MSLDSADTIRGLDGVAAVDAQIQLLFDEEAGVSFGIPELIIGAIPGADEGHEQFQLELATGRMLTPEDDGDVVVLGSTIATSHDVTSGDTIEIRGRDFEVVGTLQPTLTAPDTTALVPLSAAQEMFIETLPPLITDSVEPDELVNQIVVYPDEGVDVDVLAAQIEDAVANSATLTGAEFDEQVGASTAIFNAIIVGVAVISLVVGGLSVINTMAMSVAERTREIGIKRAIGGSRGRIIRALVAEAGLIGLIGGLIGLGLGALVVVLANEAGTYQRHRPLRPDTRDGDLRGRLLDDPRHGRRHHPRLERRSARPGRRPALRVGARTTWHCWKAATCARPTASGGGTRSRPCAAWTSRSRPARWSRSWDPRDPGRAR